MRDVDLDFGRAARIGIPEIVYGESKSKEQLQDIAAAYEARGESMLVTRCRSQQVEGLAGKYDPVARTFLCERLKPTVPPGIVGVVYAGTSDAPIAREALITLGFLGCDALEFGDCGVAGLQRILAHREALDKCNVLICCAGFEGALPSVLGGFMGQPIVAVPTSVGYGVAKDGLAALHGMLASCASGITVMNIDNGCGAAMAALRILRQLRNYGNEGINDRRL